MRLDSAITAACGLTNRDGYKPGLSHDVARETRAGVRQPILIERIWRRAAESERAIA
jgi:hypothetical protein